VVRIPIDPPVPGGEKALPDAAAGDLSRDIEALCRRWAGIVEGIAARYGLHGFDRDDLMQRVRVRIWRSLERRGPGAPALEPGYAHAAATSAAIDIVREQRAHQAGSSIPLDAADNRLGSSGAAGNTTDLLSALDAALARLDPARRVAVRFHLSGVHAKDIARMSGWTEARTRNLLYRGLADLKAELEGAGG
jgi:RNA polymerase sigma-70 factor (ECF subfamily)